MNESLLDETATKPTRSNSTNKTKENGNKYK